MDTILLRIIDIIVRTFDPDTIILFGSRARGDAREDSDFDICVLKKGISGRRTIARTLYRALYGVGVPVELIVDTPDTLRKYKDNKHLIYSEISRYGKIIYEKPSAG
ncbi:MAG: nucleotidyltransferase domain-containing protein [Methanoregula sp.]|nr:nucleotidyltransferase domain-containing protein [Methanoregula sp.]